MTRPPVKEPTRATLRKYGLDLSQWRLLLFSQGGVCAVCGNVPKSGRLCVDHFHVRGFKAMPAEDKVKFVRGLLCSYCNRYLVAKLDLTSATAVLGYLQKHEDRSQANAG